MEMNLLQVEYEQLWNVEDRSSRRLSSSEEEDTEEEAPGISSSPPQVNIGRKNKITDQRLNIQEVGPVSLPPPARQESSGARTVLTLAKKEGLPPAPPARPAKSHARSSSLGWSSLSTLYFTLFFFYQTCKRTDVAALCPPCLLSPRAPPPSSAPSTPLNLQAAPPPPGRRPGTCWAGTPRRSAQVCFSYLLN